MIQDLISRFTLDYATSFMFGNCVHSLHAPLPYAYNVVPPVIGVKDAASDAAQQFADAFAAAQHAISRRIRLGSIWPLWEMFADQTDALMHTVDIFLNPIIEEALAKHKMRIDEGKEDKTDDDDDEVTLLDHLVRYTTGE